MERAFATVEPALYAVLTVIACCGMLLFAAQAIMERLG